MKSACSTVPLWIIQNSNAKHLYLVCCCKSDVTGKTKREEFECAEGLQSSTWTLILFNFDPECSVQFSERLLNAEGCGLISTFFYFAVCVEQFPCLWALCNKPPAPPHRLFCHFFHLNLYLGAIFLAQWLCCSPLFQLIVRFGPFFLSFPASLKAINCAHTIPQTTQ